MTRPRTILVCGSRDWTDEGAIYTRLRSCPFETTVLHGGARGADTMAATCATVLGYEVREFPADWRTHGKRAGILRNHRMLDQHPDLVIAFQIDGSRGTQHTINEARRRGIPVEVHTRPAAVQPLWR